MITEKKIIRTKKGLKEYTYLGCPLTNNRTAWCFRLCAPDKEGHGRCGRLAPHAMKSKIQLGIERHNAKKKLEAHFEKLERMYLAAPCNADGEPGIRVTEGEAEIVLPIEEQHRRSGGSVHGAVYFQAMDDAASAAVNSMVDDVLVQTMNFSVCLEKPIVAGELVARGRLVDVSEGHYMAEAALADSEGNEIARGNGVYVRSEIALSSDIGYE